MAAREHFPRSFTPFAMVANRRSLYHGAEGAASTRHLDEWTMETRPYFIIGDVSCSVTVGVMSGIAVMATVDMGWPMPAAMFAGMLFGMVVAAGGIIAFGLCFGMMELHMPAMITGMLTGMVVGMLASTLAVAIDTAAILGPAIGATVYIAIWVADARLCVDRS